VLSFVKGKICHNQYAVSVSHSNEFSRVNMLPRANGQPFVSVYRVYSLITHRYFDVDIRNVVYYIKYTVYDSIFVRVIRSG
jgi:hypothetical protein